MASPAPEVQQQWHVLMLVNKYDKDEGRAWITVRAFGPRDAMEQVRQMYPTAAVLRAEAA